MSRVATVGGDSVATQEATLPVIHIDRRTVENLPAVTRPTIFYDDRLTGFGVRVFPSGAKSWIIEYRPGAGGRRVAKKLLTLGRVSDAFKADVARARARVELAKIVQGADPALERSSLRQAETVIELLDAYMNDHLRVKKKAKSVQSAEVLVRLHIAPEIGSRQAILLTHAEVARLHRLIGKRHRVTANRAVEILRAAFGYGTKSGLLPKRHDNPASDVEPFKEERRERLFSAEELARLGATLRMAEEEGLPWRPDPAKKLKHVPKAKASTVIDPHAIAAIRLLLFTGARLREILHLRWDEVDLERGLLRLPDSKTGAKTIVLGAPAVVVLESLPRLGAFVIAGRYAGSNGSDGSKEEQPRADLQRPWARVREHALLPDVRLHDLRHGFASVAAAANFSLPTIGALLGHKDASTTARYAHLAAAPLRRASDMIAGTISTALDGEKVEGTTR